MPEERSVEYIDTAEIGEPGIIGSVISFAVAPVILLLLWLLRRGINDIDNDETE
jgi:hypothetical protein